MELALINELEIKRDNVTTRMISLLPELIRSAAIAEAYSKKIAALVGITIFLCLAREGHCARILK